MKYFLLSLVAVLSLTACSANQSKSKAMDSEESEEKTHALANPEIPGVFPRFPPEAAAIVARKQGKLRAWHARLREDEKEYSRKTISELETANIRLSNDKGVLKLSLLSFRDYRPGDTGYFEATLAEQGGGVWTGEIDNQWAVVTCLPVEENKACDPTDNAVIELKSKLTLSNHRPLVIALLITKAVVKADIEGDLSSALGGPGKTTGVLTGRTILNPGAGNPTQLSLLWFSNLFGNTKNKQSPPADMISASTSFASDPVRPQWSFRSSSFEGVSLKAEKVQYDGESITFTISHEGRYGLVRAGVPRGLTLPQ